MEDVEVSQEAEVDTPWVTIVWNDPVNLMSYVTFVFMQYFGYPRTKAESLMMDVHTEGKALVSSGSRDQMERDVTAMHSYGLWATMSRDH
jgi:ATP-dependent Clp protease adaptor protein ClpS